MGSSIYPIAIGMSIVILSFAVAVVAIIKARAKFGNSSFTGRNEPIAKEESETCREDFDTLPKYYEAMLAEQLLNRITMCKIACAESERLFLELNNVPTKVTKASQYKVEIASDRNIYNHKAYLHAISSAAHWHLEGLISFEVYNHFFLKNAVSAYDEIYTAQFYSAIVEVVNRYGHLVKREEYVKDDENEDETEPVTEKEDK